MLGFFKGLHQTSDGIGGYNCETSNQMIGHKLSSAYNYKLSNKIFPDVNFDLTTNIRARDSIIKQIKAFISKDFLTYLWRKLNCHIHFAK